jgi:hypothetical protein
MRHSNASGLARIYGFSYQGNYYKLATPTVLLVYGEGEPIPPSIQPVALSLVGVEFKDETFSDEVRMWSQDQTDYSVRIDITPGWLEDILLIPELSTEANVTGGDSPELTGRSQVVGRSQIVGRSQLVGRSQVVGRGDK